MLDRFSILTHILPYYGWSYDWVWLLKQLSKKHKKVLYDFDEEFTNLEKLMDNSLLEGVSYIKRRFGPPPVEEAKLHKLPSTDIVYLQRLEVHLDFCQNVIAGSYSGTRIAIENLAIYGGGEDNEYSVAKDLQFIILASFCIGKFELKDIYFDQAFSQTNLIYRLLNLQEISFVNCRFGRSEKFYKLFGSGESMLKKICMKNCTYKSYSFEQNTLSRAVKEMLENLAETGLPGSLKFMVVNSIDRKTLNNLKRSFKELKTLGYTFEVQAGVKVSKSKGDTPVNPLIQEEDNKSLAEHYYKR